MRGFKALIEDRWFIIAVLLFGTAIRLHLLIANHFVIDSDEAIVGLMAKHILDGQPVPVFYYGQSYMGTLEPILVAALFSLVGVSNVALKLVPLFFALALIPLIYLLALEVSNRFGARIAALYLALPPSALVIWSSMARGGFIEVVFIGTLALYYTVRWLKSDHPSSKDTALVGFLLGVGWWVNNQIIYFILPIGFAFMARLVSDPDLGTGRLKRLVRELSLGLGVFILGGLPFWLHNLKYNFESFRLLTHAKEGQLGSQFSGLFETALPIIFGAKRFWQHQDLFPSSTCLAWIIVGLLALILLFYRRAELLALFKLQIDRRRPIELFILFVIATLAVFALSAFGYLVEAPRYLLPLYTALALLLGVALAYLRPYARVVSYLLVAIILGLNLASSYLGGHSIPGEPFVFNGQRVSKDHSELIAWLRAQNIQWVRTNYWIGYRLAFETEEAVKFRLWQAPHQVRIPSYEAHGSAQTWYRLPVVLVPAQADVYRRALQTLGYRFHETTLSNYHVIYDIEPTQKKLKRVPTADLTAVTVLNQAGAVEAIDGKVSTRWGSASPQAPGAEFRVNFKTPRTLRGFRYKFGQWPHDYPRGLKIMMQLPSGEERLLLDPEHYVSVRYLEEYDSQFSFYFRPVTVKSVTLVQLGKHPVFDWSIAELEFFE